MFKWLFKRDNAEVKALKRKITNIECLIEHEDAMGRLNAIDHIELLNAIIECKEQLKEKES